MSAAIKQFSDYIVGDKLELYKITYRDKFHVVVDVEALEGVMRDKFFTKERKSEVRITAITMSKDEFESLPKFSGWSK